MPKEEQLWTVPGQNTDCPGGLLVLGCSLRSCRLPLETGENICLFSRKTVVSQKQKNGVTEVVGLSCGIRLCIVGRSGGIRVFERPCRDLPLRGISSQPRSTLEKLDLDVGVPCPF